MRIATRAQRALARWQAEHVAAALREGQPGLEVELVAVTTTADRRLDVPISSLGGKGVFAKEIQAALLDGRADLAVHSAKDLPSTTVPGLVLAAVPERGDARDALCGRRLDELSAGSTVGTGSARRRVQLAALRPDVRFVELRGNMSKRLSRLDELDAIVVAAVALYRLGLADRLSEVFDVGTVVPQVGQGALAVECRADDAETIDRVARIQHGPSRRRLDAERAFLARLGGDCTMPAGAHAVIGPDGRLTVTGVLAASGEEPGRRWACTETVDGADPEVAGRAVADALLEGGGSLSVVRGS